MNLTCAAETSLIVATLRTQPTSKLVRCLVGTDRPVGVSRLVGVLSIRISSILGSAAKRRHPANAPTTLKTTDSVYGVPIPLVRVWGFLLWFWFGSFLVLDDAICVVGKCGFSQCAVPRSTVPFPMTPPYVDGASSFFLSSFSLTTVATLPGSPTPGVSTTLPFGDQLAAV